MGKYRGKMAMAGVAALVAVAMAEAAQAQDFFSSMFGSFGFNRPRPMTPLPYAGEEGTVVVPQGRSVRRRVHSYGGGSQAYCVRTCDGRYFPISSSGNQSRAASCNSFCPASETKVVYGSNIENAATEDGTNYSELPNAFRYRDELVAGCTCNGKDPAGLAKMKVEDDPTLRRGDIVVGDHGLMVAGRGSDRRGASLGLSPAPESVQSRYRHVPIVASQ
jgi:hypothetical protein